MNDATGLVLYKFAVAAALSGTFSDCTRKRPIRSRCRRRRAGRTSLSAIFSCCCISILHDSLIEIMLSLTLPYTAYLLAETLHVSGVLAVVAAGLMRARHAPEVFSPQTRLLGRSVWQLMVFVLNSLIFIMIGLQIPETLAALGNRSLSQLLGLGISRERRRNGSAYGLGLSVGLYSPFA